MGPVGRVIPYNNTNKNPPGRPPSPSGPLPPGGHWRYLQGVKYTNYHCHTEFCDGQSTALDMANTAWSRGFSTLGFSSHAPLPFSTGWTMEEARLADYIAEIKRLRQLFAGRMEILLGFEADWYPGKRVPGDAFWQGVERDFLIGSVHFIIAPDGTEYTVDDKPEKLARVLGVNYLSDSKKLVSDYWAAQRDLIRHGQFDILGHFDLIRKNNGDCKMFSDSDSWYRKEVMATIEELAAHPVVVEVNLGGMARGRTFTPYPEVWMLKELHQRHIPVCLCSDAHHPDHLSLFREAGISAMKTAGYREHVYLSGGGWQTEALD